MTGKSARQISLTDQPAFQDGASDYADSAYLERPMCDNRSAEEWARAGLEGAPWILRRIIPLTWRMLLRFTLAPIPSEDHILGWRILECQRSALHLESLGPLFHGHLFWEIRDTSIHLTTYIRYTRPGRLAPAVWAAVGAFHRFLAPIVLNFAAADARSARP